MTDLFLKQANVHLGLATISHIKTSLDRLFGKGTWMAWEPETISLELGMELDDLLLEKLHVLQVIEQLPELFFEDVTFLLFATEVINNNVVDFDSVPASTSLELAFAITEVKKILMSNGQTPIFSDGVGKAVAWMLRQEGYSKPLEPFDFVPDTLLESGQTPNDIADKKKAIETYIAHMNAL